MKNEILLLASIILVVAMGFFIYSNSLNGKFIWDDDILIRNNLYIKHWSYVPKIFVNDWGEGAGTKYTFYRPLCLFTYLVNYSLNNLDVRGYHLVNVILHILVALTLYWLITFLFNNRLLSFLTSVFFVAHPIHTEAVSYISGRPDSLALLFMLVSSILYIKYLNLKQIHFYLLALLSYVLALLSKENSLILPLLFLLYHHTLRKRIKIISLASFFGLTFIYLLLRLTVLKSALLGMPSFNAALARIPGFFVAIINYIRLLFLPINLHMEYGNNLFSPGDPRAIIGLIVSFFLLLYAIRKRNSILSFSFLWFFITLMPVSNLYPLAFYMAEHYLYIPSIGFFLILANGLDYLYKIKHYRTLTISVAILLLTFYSYSAIKQNVYWREPITFYRRTLEFYPQSSRIHYNLGLVYMDMDKKEEAIQTFKKAIEINPNYAMSYNSLGNLYESMGQEEEAINFYEKAIEVNPLRKEAYYGLGNVYSNIKKQNEAINMYKSAIKIDPDYAAAYNNLGAEYVILGKKEEAINSFKKAIELDPDNAEAHNNLAVVYYYTNQLDLARKHCNRALDLGYEVPEGFLKLLELKGN